MTSPCVKHFSDSPSLTEYSTGSYIVINEALSDLGPTSVGGLSPSVVMFAPAIRRGLRFPQISPAVLLLHTSAYAVPQPRTPSSLSTRERSFPDTQARRHLPKKPFSSSSLRGVPSPPALFGCPVPYMFLGFTCLLYHILSPCPYFSIIER